MAASSVIPAPTGRRADRGLVARTAARTAPRGPGLAAVVALPLRGTDAGPGVVHRSHPSVVSVTPGHPEGRDERRAEARPALRVVAPLRRTAPQPVRALMAVTAVALILAVLVGSVRAALVEPTMPVAAGHVVLEPGETLWDVAVRSAPAGVDPREQLDVLRRLNGFGSATLDAWTVVLIPAP